MITPFSFKTTLALAIGSLWRQYASHGVMSIELTFMPFDSASTADIPTCPNFGEPYTIVGIAGYEISSGSVPVNKPAT